jgi:lipopolysaccharide kinase (Kdo/WaaP) family protein
MNQSQRAPTSPSRDTLWRRWFRGVRRMRQRPEWLRVVGADWPERIMGVTATDDYHAKQGRSTGRWLAQTPGGQLAVYLKRHYRLPRWRGLLAALWPNFGWSPALQEWRHLQWARRQGIPVPTAVAACEYIGPWGRLQSFLAVEELTDMQALHQAIPAAAAQLEPVVFRQWKRGLSAELARLTRALHERRCFHKDLYLCHFYIPRADTDRLPTDWRGRVHVIDLHRLAHHAWSHWLWQAKDLGQLLYSSNLPGIDARDRLHFWRLYLGNKRRVVAAAWLRRLVLIKAWSYRRHNRRKQRRAA